MNDNPYSSLAAFLNTTRLVHIRDGKGRRLSFIVDGVTQQSVNKLRDRLAEEPECSLVQILRRIRPDVDRIPTITFSRELNHVKVVAPGCPPNGSILDESAHALLWGILRFPL